MDALQWLTDQVWLDSVKGYAKNGLARKCELMERQMIRCEARGIDSVGIEPKKYNDFCVKWRKCMGIEPTRDGISAPHRI